MNKTSNMPTPPVNQAKKARNRLIGTVTAIVIAGVALSGGAAYGGYKLAASQSASKPYSADSQFVPGYSHSSGSGNTVQVLDVSDVVQVLRPSVVEINTEVVTNSYFGQGIAQGAGSGIIISEDGYIVTNNHVIAGANKISIGTYDGQTMDAVLVGTDPQTDVAVIKVDATGLTPASFGNSDEIKVGEAVIAIGNPLGSLGGTVTTGIISAVGREITIENETMTLLQTDAAINQGNSGGGLFDINGDLIGIVNAKQSAEGIEGLGFAIPISDVTSVIQDLVKNGKVTSRPLLGVSLQDIPEGVNTQTEPGVYIVQITDGSSAADAGLEYGDLIVSFDGQNVSSAAEVKSILRQHAIGDEVEMVVNRDGTEHSISITLKGPAVES